MASYRKPPADGNPRDDQTPGAYEIPQASQTTTTAHGTIAGSQMLTTQEKPQQGYSAGAMTRIPATQYGDKYVNSLADCCSPFSLCCLSFWCTCFVVGRTYDRDEGKGETHGCNAWCCLWTLATYVGFNSCFQCMTRMRQRERFGIEGNAGKDFIAGLCCCVCQVVQAEKESILRVNGVDPKTNEAYRPVDGMTYA